MRIQLLRFSSQMLTMSCLVSSVFVCTESDSMAGQVINYAPWYVTVFDWGGSQKVDIPPAIVIGNSVIPGKKTYNTESVNYLGTTFPADKNAALAKNAQLSGQNCINYYHRFGEKDTLLITPYPVSETQDFYQFSPTAAQAKASTIDTTKTSATIYTLASAISEYQSGYADPFPCNFNIVYGGDTPPPPPPPPPAKPVTGPMVLNFTNSSSTALQFTANGVSTGCVQPSGTGKMSLTVTQPPNGTTNGSTSLDVYGSACVSGKPQSPQSGVMGFEGWLVNSTFTLNCPTLTTCQVTSDTPIKKPVTVKNREMTQTFKPEK
jgi:hypothetical protein